MTLQLTKCQCLVTKCYHGCMHTSFNESQIGEIETQYYEFKTRYYREWGIPILYFFNIYIFRYKSSSYLAGGVNI
jgi:hypothetical protein